MPVYDYVCKDCRNSFELILTLREHDKGEIKGTPNSAIFDVSSEASLVFAIADC